ncbi:MAG: xanthine dehydrogenase molybdopterin binding subunit, partial [Pseudomonadota bacterium]
WLTMEELWWDEAGRLRTHAPSTYKIPTASDRPPVMNIRLWEKGMNRELTIKRSKAVGEPPLMLANSVHQAISHAISFCGDAYPDLDAPATPERILGAITRLRA